MATPPIFIDPAPGAAPTSSTSAPTKAPRLLLVALLLVVLLTLLGRLLGPSDLDAKDQPRTISFTVDMVVNGRWLWPRDLLGMPWNKPPFYNWLAAPAILLTGDTSETTHKLPSIVAGLLTAGLLFAAGRRLMPSAGPTLPVLAAILFLANWGSWRLIYIARPDMVLTLFMTSGWLAGSILLTAPPTDPLDRPNRLRALQAALWLSILAAAMTKGLPALLLLAYLPLAARLCAGRWSAIRQTGAAWGLPLVLLLGGGWFAFGLFVARGGDAKGLVDVETHRLVGSGLRELLRTSYQMPQYFLARFFPWSLLFVALLIRLGHPRNWWRHETGPAILWVLLRVAVLSCWALKRDDYLLPTYPAAALAVAWLVDAQIRPRWRPAPAACAAVAIGLCALTAYLDTTPSAGNTAERFGDHTRAFAHRVREAAGHEPIAFVWAGYQPLQPLLGVNQAGQVPSREQWAAAKWVIQPIDETPSDCPRPLAEPVAVSEPIPRVLHAGLRHPARLGLYRKSDVEASPEFPPVHVDALNPPPPAEM